MIGAAKRSSLTPTVTSGRLCLLQSKHPRFVVGVRKWTAVSVRSASRGTCIQPPALMDLGPSRCKDQSGIVEPL